MARNDSNYYPTGNQHQSYYGDDSRYYADAHQQAPRPRRESDGYNNRYRNSYGTDNYQDSNKQEVSEEDDNYYYNQQQQHQPYDNHYRYEMASARSTPQPPPLRYDPNPAAYHESYQDPKRYDSRYDSPAPDSNPYPLQEDYRPVTPVSHAPSDYYRNNNSSLNLGTPTHDSPPSLSQRNSIFTKGLSSHHHHEKFDDDDDAPRKPSKKRSLLNILCCGCCKCFPKWLRWTCCVLLILIIALAITIGILAAMFKIPNIKYLGVHSNTDGTPQFTANVDKSWTLNTVLKFQIDNPNIEYISFSSVRAVAYYPTTQGKKPRPSIGGGNIQSLFIGAKSTTIVDFPFSINYSKDVDPDQAILTDIATKCGLLGSQKSPLTIDYDLTLGIKVVFFTISPTFSQSAKFDCPIQNGQLPELPSGIIPNT